jgi:hypothetical protein
MLIALVAYSGPGLDEDETGATVLSGRVAVAMRSRPANSAALVDER